MAHSVLLINTNVVRPPVSPIGLEYLGECLLNANLPLEVLDLALTSDWKSALQGQLKDNEPLIIGITIRNTDDCSFISRKSYLPWIKEVISEIRNLTAAPIIVGGVGFSIMSDMVMQTVAADYGIKGDGEITFTNLVKYLMNNKDFTGLPNLIYVRANKIIHNEEVYIDLNSLPVPHRQIFDNKRYEELGAQIGIETKRGCNGKCIYCADPVAKGNKIRLKNPEIIAQELRYLVNQGVSWFHLCDSEFNIPIEHAKDICRTIIQSKLEDKIRWYCYCSPIPFDEELAELMKSAGCAGINFGIDSLCDEQLKRLGRKHSFHDIAQLVNLLNNKNLNYMCDLLLGGPGETEKTIELTINRAKELNISLVGAAIGMRIYPDTSIGKVVADGTIKEGLYPKTDISLDEPIFYLSPALGPDAFDLVKNLINNDPRFLFLSSPDEEGSYNYADDEALCQLIQQGGRGAYWDIIRKNLGI